MRWSPERLRWLLLGGAVVLAALLSALFGLSSYRAGKVWQRILARNGVNIRRESNGVTYSQSKGGRTIFTVHAGKSVPHGNGQWTLDNVVLILYGKDGRDDRISGSQFEYDEKQGILSAVGDVHLDLQTPTATGKAGEPVLSFSPDDATAVDPGLIHVRTRGLVYTRKLELATTNQPTEFRYKDLTCVSRGAAFDAQHNSLRMPADVRLTGTLQNKPFTLTATEATLDRQSDQVTLQQPVAVTGDETAKADVAVLALHANGALDRGDAKGGVEVRSGSETVHAPLAHATFAEDNHLEHLQLEEGVSFVNTDPIHPSQGVAQTVSLGMDSAGRLQTAVGRGGVRLLTHAGAPNGPLRQMVGDAAEAAFTPGPSGAHAAVLRQLRLTGHAGFSGSSAGAAGRSGATTRVMGDMLLANFRVGADGNVLPQHLVGSGHTQLEQATEDGAHTLSTGNHLDASFAARAGGGSVELTQAVQTGGVELRSSPAPKAGAPAEAESTGRGEKAVFAAGEGTLTLSGHEAEVVSADTALLAPVIVLHQGTGNAEASGGVNATTGGASGGVATHVLADHAALLHGPQLSEFYGAGSRPAQLWQAGSQVQAAKLILDGPNHSLSARQEAGGRVEAVFASAGGSKGDAEILGRTSPTPRHVVPTAGKGTPAASRNAVTVRAGGMDFSDLQHEATFTGGVEMQGPEGVITGEHGAAFLAAPRAGAPAKEGVRPAVAGFGGQLERLVVLGDVRLRQPGRLGTGAQMTYTAGSGNYVLTGTAATPPRIMDVQQGTVTGATLVFGAPESSIVVAGAPGGVNKDKPTRVHTETDLKPQ